MTFPYPNQRFTSFLGLSLFGMDEVLADNFNLLDAAYGAGSSINVNGTLVSAPNLSSTLPVAPAGKSLVTFQVDVNGNISAYYSQGTSVIIDINGVSVTSPNFNDTTPSAPVGYVNAKWQLSGNSVSVYTPVFPATTTQTAHSFFTTYSATTGVFGQAQPAAADLSDTATSGNVLRGNGTSFVSAQLGYSDLSGTPSALPPNGSAGGDLSGTYPNPTIGDLQGIPLVYAPAPIAGQVLEYDGVAWTPTTLPATPTILYLDSTASSNGGVAYTLSQVSVSGATTTYTGVFADGGSNDLLGRTFVITGFVTHTGNNVTMVCTGSTTTTITCTTTTQVNETNPATATKQRYLWATAPSGVEATIATSVTSAMGNYTLAAFCTAVGVPNTTTIPAGSWQFDLYIQTSAAAGTQTLYVNVLKRSNTNVETQLFTTSGALQTFSGNGTGVQLISFESIQGAFSVLTTDVLVIQVVVNVSATRTVTLYMDGTSHYSHVHTPVTTSQSSVQSIFGRTGIVTAQSGDYTAAQVTNAFDTSVSQTKNTVYAAPDGSNGTPSFRALVTGDIPSGIVTWNKLGNAAGALTLANAAYNTTFDQTAAATWLWANTTAATGTATASAYPPQGTGTVNAASAGPGSTSQAVTVNVNANDTVIVFVSTSSNSSNPTVTDNASGGSNVYTQLGTLNSLYESVFVCLSAKAATSITATLSGQTIYTVSAATFTGVSGIGEYLLTPASATSGTATGTITTSGAYSLVVGCVFCGHASTLTPTSGTPITNLNEANINCAVSALQVASSGTVSSITATISPSSIWIVLLVELLANPAAATNSNSPIVSLAGTYYNGSASAADTWTIQDSMTSVNNPVSTLTFAHAGSSGLAQVSFPAISSVLSYGNVIVQNIASGTPTTTNASPLLELEANYFTGSASAVDTWSLKSSLAAGANGASTLTFTHTGSSGTASVQLPATTFTAVPTFPSQTANQVFAAPNGSSGAPTFRALVAADIPSGIVTWDKLGNAGGALTLANAGNATTFNQTSAVTWAWANTTAATGTLAYPAQGTGATNAASAGQNATSQNVTVNVNANDTIVVFVSASNNTVTPVISDNASGGSNVYTQIGTILTSYGYESMFYCLSAKAATTITATVTGLNVYSLMAATFTGVIGIGQFETSATASSGTATGTINTTGAKSLLVGAVYCPHASSITPTSGSSITGINPTTVNSSFLILQVATPGSASLSATISASATWGVLAVELLTNNAATNNNSPLLSLAGTYSNGAASPSGADTWTIQDSMTSVVNPVSTLTFAHAGSSGLAQVSFPAISSVLSYGNIVAQTTTTATPTSTLSSPLLELVANYYTGSASAADTWSLQSSIAAGANGKSTLTFAHSGSTGNAKVVLPAYGVSSSNGYWYYGANFPSDIYTLNQGVSDFFGFKSNSATFYGSSGAVIGFGSSNTNLNQAGVVDTGISRTAGGAIAVGNGVQGNTSGTLNAATFIENTSLSPTSAATAGTTGQIAWDVNNIYICTSGGAAGSATWKKVALTTD